ncbi:MAG: hypothetical protein CMK98_13745 [Pseudomonas sp.]|nr:hypothetical protein [Pseudomonas sp.]
MRRLAFAHIDQLQTELVNSHDGWPKVPTGIRGHVEALRDIIEVGIPQDVPSPEVAAGVAEALIRQLPAADRDQARTLMIRRLKHPEGAGIDTYHNPHPRSSGRNYANSVANAALCLRCNRDAESHGIDGQDGLCDGFVT